MKSEEMSGREYEQFVAEELRRLGYKKIELTKASGDYGVDIVCEKKGERWAVQCKYYSSNVGVAAVQQAAAGKAMYGCERAMVVTNSRFTSQARELAEQNGVELMEELAPGGSVLKVIFAVLCITYITAACAVVLSEAMSGGNAARAAAIAAAPAAAIAAAGVWARRRRGNNKR